MKNRYRIVQDDDFLYRVQVRYWWLPIFWLEAGTIGNSHRSIERAEKYMRVKMAPVIRECRHD